MQVVAVVVLAVVLDYKVRLYENIDLKGAQDLIFLDEIPELLQVLANLLLRVRSKAGFVLEVSTLICSLAGAARLQVRKLHFADRIIIVHLSLLVAGQCGRESGFLEFQGCLVIAA